jgi:hypothetical protein
MRYRAYRLRRLICVCGISVVAGLAAGVWLAGFSGPLAQPAALLVMFGLFGGTLVAMALRWPHAVGETLTYAVGTGVMLAALIPFSVYMAATEDRQSLGIVLAVMFGPLIWLIGAPLVGAAILFPLDRMIHRDHTSTSRHHVPMPLDVARGQLSFRPDTQSGLSICGSIGWDGFWEEAAIRYAPDPKNGAIVKTLTISRVKELDAGDFSQSVMVLPQQAGDLDNGVPNTIVIHTTFAADGTGTQVTRHASMDQISQGRLTMMWLADLRADIMTAECDLYAGQAQRALIYLPTDSMWTALQRFFRWDGRPSH